MRLDSPVRCDADDQLAWIFRANQRWLLALLRLHQPSEAEDLLQETYLRAARGWRKEAVRHPRAWLAAIALNLVREQRRRQASRPPAPDTSSLLERGNTAAPSEQDETLFLKQIISGLPPKLRDAFVLHRFEGLTYPEIAQRLNISTKTVEWRISRALEICAARLRD